MVLYLTIALPVLCITAIKGSTVVVSLYALELGAGAATIGLLIGLYGLFPTLLSVAAGRLLDRSGYFPSLAWGALGMTAGMLLPFALPTMLGLMLSAALIGLSNVYFIVAMQSLTNRIGEPAARARNVANFSLAVSIGQLVGPVLAGLLIDGIGHRFTYLVLAVLPLGTLAMLAALKSSLPPPPGGDVAVAKPNLVGMLTRPELRSIYVMSAVSVAGVDLFAFFLPIYGHSIQLSASVIGLILGAFAAAAFVIRALMPWLIDRLGETRLLVQSLFLSGVAYFLFPFVTSPGLLALLSFALGLGLGCGQPLTMMMCYNRAPPGRSGEALGVRFTIVNMAHMSIPIVFGSMGTALGVLAVFWANGGLLVASGAIGSLLERRK
ncbi:MAG: MFS transporter [Proteobacteria bacterium]|nr:MFS transporter [Burkholderiales bacterium]